MHSLIAAAVVTILFTAASVHAQAPVPPRQPQGLFGGVSPDATATQRMDFTASLVEGYDSDVPTALLPSIDPGSPQSGGFSTILNAAAEYSWRNTRTQVGLNGTSVVRHYADLGETRSVGSSVGAGVSVRLPWRLTLMANQAGAYTPAYLSGLFPVGGDVVPGSPGITSPDYIVSDFKSYTHSTSASLRHDFSQRSNVLVSGDYRYTDRRQETPFWRDLSAQWFRGEYSRTVSRNTTITGQYRYRSGAFGYTSELRAEEHGLEFGVRFQKPLSATRRADFRFSLGVSAADAPLTIPGASGTYRQYLGSASAEIAYQFQRSWQGRVNYRRGIEYVIDIPEPVFADSVSVGVEGLVSRRIDFSMSAGYSSGDSILNASALSYDTYIGTLRTRYALTRIAAVYGEYLYYFYDFAPGTPLLAGVPPGLERHGVRAGLTLWMPALRK